MCGFREGLVSHSVHKSDLPFTESSSRVAFTRAPGPESGSESGSQSTWERWSESGFESSLAPCKCNQSVSGSESPCKRGLAA